MLIDVISVTDGLTSAAPTMSSLSAATSKDDDDYVWDVFYQRPTTFQDLYTPTSSISGNIATL